MTEQSITPREIKFRVWEIAEKRFVDYYSIGEGIVHVAIGDQYFLTNNLNASEEHKKYLQEKNLPIKDEFVLLQFTGLKDKNGKEIYEGDLLRYPADNDWNKENFTAYEVFFHDGDANSDYNIGFSISRAHHQGAIAGNIIRSFKPKTTRQMEICGNIYETPELISSPLNQ